MKTTTLHIGGMTCSHCVSHVTKTLLSLPGVTKVHVDLESGVATVERDERTAETVLIRAVEDEGYEART